MYLERLVHSLPPIDVILGSWSPKTHPDHGCHEEKSETPTNWSDYTNVWFSITEAEALNTIKPVTATNYRIECFNHQVGYAALESWQPAL
jgi:hypothetical protein